MAGMLSSTTKRILRLGFCTSMVICSRNERVGNLVYHKLMIGQKAVVRGRSTVD